ITRAYAVGFCELALRAGLEPATFRLTAERSTIELPGSASNTFGGSLTNAPTPVKDASRETREFHARENLRPLNRLLQAGDAGMEADKGIKNGEDVTAVHI